MRLKAVALGVLVFAASAGAQLPVAPAGRVPPPDERGTREELGEAMRQCTAAGNAAGVSLRRDLDACNSAAELLAATTRSAAELAAKRRPAVARVLAGIRPTAATPAAVEALAWVAASWYDSAEASAEAAGLLNEHHLTHLRTLNLAYWCREEPTLWSEGLLKAQLAAGDLPADRRLGLLHALAVTKQNQAEAAKAVRAMGATQVEMWRVRHGSDLLASYRRLDIKAAEDEAVALFGEIEAKYGPEEFRRALTFAGFAKLSVYEIRNLQVGQVAPDFVGEDFAGAKYRLSQSRGKVVAVVFCSGVEETRKALDGLKHLSTSRADEPFELVSVHSARERVLTAEALTGAGATWRTLWCDEKLPKTDIATAWNVLRNPMIYLLDAQGVIRLKEVPRGQSIPYEIKALLAELAAKK